MRFLLVKNYRNTLSKDKQDFFKKVHQVAMLIPPGRITTYGAIAEFLGTKSSARVVGWAMNAAHGNLDIPAHRVVNRLGMLSGKHHFEGVNLMQQLLESEGVKVIDNQVQNFEQIFWNPSKEL